MIPCISRFFFVTLQHNMSLRHGKTPAETAHQKVCVGRSLDVHWVPAPRKWSGRSTYVAREPDVSPPGSNDEHALPKLCDTLTKTRCFPYQDDALGSTSYSPDFILASLLAILLESRGTSKAVHSIRQPKFPLFFLVFSKIITIFATYLCKNNSV